MLVQPKSNKILEFKGLAMFGNVTTMFWQCFFVICCKNPYINSLGNVWQCYCNVWQCLVMLNSNNNDVRNKH